MKQLPENMPKHQIEALQKGESVWFGNQMYLPSDLPTAQQLLAERSESGRQVFGDVKDSPEYKALAADAQKAIEAIRADVLEFLPTDPAVLGKFSGDKLRKLLRIRGIDAPKNATKEDFVKLLGPGDRKSPVEGNPGTPVEPAPPVVEDPAGTPNDPAPPAGED